MISLKRICTFEWISEENHVTTALHLEKNHTHVKTVGTPQNFLMAFIDKLWKTRKTRILKKRKKIAGDIIILHMCTKNHNHTRYSSSIFFYNLFLVILGHFLPFTLPLPPNNPENQNFEKMKKVSGDVIILNLCNKKHNQMMYAYSDMECNRHNFLLF